MWLRFRASFSSREHLLGWLLAVVAAVLMGLCVGALLFAWLAL